MTWCISLLRRDERARKEHEAEEPLVLQQLHHELECCFGLFTEGAGFFFRAIVRFGYLVGWVSGESGAGRGRFYGYSVSSVVT